MKWIFLKFFGLGEPERVRHLKNKQKTQSASRLWVIAEMGNKGHRDGAIPWQGVAWDHEDERGWMPRELKKS